MNGADLAVIVGILVGTGGIVGGIVAWRKGGSERTNIMVSTAQLLVGLSREEVERLDKRLDEQTVRIEALETERHQLQRELEAERLSNRELRVKNAELTERVQQLEDEVVRLRDGGMAP